MKKRIALALISISILAIGSLVAAPSASASGSTYRGCPSGAVCLYTNDPNGTKFLQGHPDWVWFSYGRYNISGAIGHGEYVDNQVGGGNIGSYLCSGSNGTGTITTNGLASGPNHIGGGGPTGVGQWTSINFTPVNSVVVSQHWAVRNPGTPCPAP